MKKTLLTIAMSLTIGFNFAGNGTHSIKFHNHGQHEQLIIYSSQDGQTWCVYKIFEVKPEIKTIKILLPKRDNSTQFKVSEKIIN